MSTYTTTWVDMVLRCRRIIPVIRDCLWDFDLPSDERDLLLQRFNIEVSFFESAISNGRNPERYVHDIYSIYSLALKLSERSGVESS